MRWPPWLMLLAALLWMSVARVVHAGNNVWTSLGPEVPIGVTGLAIDPLPPTTLYAGTDGRDVFKSTDGGSSWSALNTGSPYSTVAGVLAVDPRTPTTLYAGTGGGVFKSTDGGS